MFWSISSSLKLNLAVFIFIILRVNLISDLPSNVLGSNIATSNFRNYGSDQRNLETTWNLRQRRRHSWGPTTCNFPRPTFFANKSQVAPQRSLDRWELSANYRLSLKGVYLKMSCTPLLANGFLFANQSSMQVTHSGFHVMPCSARSVYNNGVPCCSLCNPYSKSLDDRLAVLWCMTFQYCFGLARWRPE